MTTTKTIDADGFLVVKSDNDVHAPQNNHAIPARPLNAAECLARFNVAHLELHISAFLVQLASFSKQVRDVGGKYSDCRGGNTKRFVEVPASAPALADQIISDQHAAMQRINEGRTKGRREELVTVVVRGGHMNSSVLAVRNLADLCAKLEAMYAHLSSKGYVPTLEAKAAETSRETAEREESKARESWGTDRESFDKVRSFIMERAAKP